jgi:alpha-methylacyl-CoA racemase
MTTPAMTTPAMTTPAMTTPAMTTPGTAPDPGRGPLRGLRVLELGGIGPVPFAGMLLSDLGADVVQVARPGAAGTGEPVRFNVMNRGRRSVALDLSSPDGRDHALDLIAVCDAVLEGFRPGVAERLGVGPDAAFKRNPAVAYGRMTGWGQDGPLAARAGHDINYIARSGLLHAVGRAGQPPTVPLNIGGDFGGGGALLALGVLAACHEAARSGHGQVVDAAMTEGSAVLIAMVHGLAAAGEWADERGVNLIDSGRPYYDVYATADGRYVSVGALEDKFYRELLDRLDLAGLPDREDPASWPAIRAALTDRFARRTQAEWEQVFDGVDACVAPVRSLAEAPADPQLRARGVFAEIGGVLQPLPSPRFSRTPAGVPAPPPQPGAHTDEVLRSWLAPAEVVS